MSKTEQDTAGDVLVLAAHLAELDEWTENSNAMGFSDEKIKAKKTEVFKAGTQVLLNLLVDVNRIANALEHIALKMPSQAGGGGGGFVFDRGPGHPASPSDPGPGHPTSRPRSAAADENRGLG